MCLLRKSYAIVIVALLLIASGFFAGRIESAKKNSVLDETASFTKKDLLSLVINSYVSQFNDFDTNFMIREGQISVRVYHTDWMDKTRAQQLLIRICSNIGAMVRGSYPWAKKFKIQGHTVHEARKTYIHPDQVKNIEKYVKNYSVGVIIDNDKGVYGPVPK